MNSWISFTVVQFLVYLWAKTDIVFIYFKLINFIIFRRACGIFLSDKLYFNDIALWLLWLMLLIYYYDRLDSLFLFSPFNYNLDLHRFFDVGATFQPTFWLQCTSHHNQFIAAKGQKNSTWYLLTCAIIVSCTWYAISGCTYFKIAHW